jgi:hypothetical protein
VMTKTMLDRLLARGVKVRPMPDGAVELRGLRKIPPFLRAEIQANSEELKAHVAARWCHRCTTVAARTVIAYWDHTVKVCPDCCLVLAVEFDRARSWPIAPWTLDDLRGRNVTSNARPLDDLRVMGETP